MTGIIEPKPEFRSITEAAVLAALGDADPRNRIAVEVVRLSEAYSARFRTDGGGSASIRAEIFRFRPRCPIEAVAMRLATDGFEGAVIERLIGGETLQTGLSIVAPTGFEPLRPFDHRKPRDSRRRRQSLPDPTAGPVPRDIDPPLGFEARSALLLQGHSRPVVLLA